jgi:hypothetical protein
MEQEEGIIWSLGRRGYGFIRTPGRVDRIFWVKDAPAGLEKGRSVTYRVVPRPNEEHPKAVDIRLMEVA